jgi:cytoskeletal protein CcmA (bactofilin family)
MSDSKLRRLRDSTGGPGTLISEGCKIEGVLSGAGNFLINGEVEGDCDIDGSVTLARNGFWKGTIRAGTIIVAGTIEGYIVASGRVEISDSAKIKGTISGEEIAVAEGAIVDGEMQTTGRSEPVEFVEKRQAENHQS